MAELRLLIQNSSDPLPGARPLLRGVLHEVGFVVACLAGIPLLVTLDGRRLVAAAVFAGSAATMLGVSALYHRVTWGPRTRPWMRRADHAGVYLLIAGTYTPVGLLSLHGSMQRVVLAVVWFGAHDCPDIFSVVLRVLSVPESKSGSGAPVTPAIGLITKESVGDGPRASIDGP